MKTLPSTCAFLLFALAGCNADRGADDAAATTAAPPAASDLQAPVAAPQPQPPAPAPAGGPMPAAGAISFSGFGPAAWGANEEALRMAWGKDLEAAQALEAGGCYYLFPQPKPETGYRMGFMLEGSKFVRIDVDAPGIAAPGGGNIGMSKAQITALYAGRIEQQPHKYTDGEYLRIKDAAGGNGVLIFETDAKGDAAKVTEWRVGVPPQVDYVEGCS